MNIIFFTDTFFPAHNGIINSLINYANGLAKKDHDVLIIAPFHPQAQKMDWGLDSRVKVILQPSIALGVYPEFRMMIPTLGLFRRIKAFSPHIIHTHYAFIAGWIGLLYGKYVKVPQIATCNTHYDHPDSLKFFGLPNNKFFRIMHSILQSFVILFFKSHTRILAASKSIQRYLLSKKLPSEIVFLPIPTQLLRNGRSLKDQLRANHTIGKTTLISVGRLSGEKNVDKVIQLFSILSSKIPTLELVIVGDGPERKKLERLAKEYSFSEQIHFIGAINYAQLIAEGWFYVGDVFITMSEFEAQGMSTVEAMACGLPVVAIDASANSEIVTDVGILLPKQSPKVQAELIESVFLDKEKYHKLSQKSLQKAEEYSIDSCVSQLIKIYKEAYG